MRFFLEAIKLNHDPTSAGTDALNIRRNGTQFVTVPEWRRGVSVKPEDSPAAYAIRRTRGNKITIQAKFECDDPAVHALEIRAIDGRINPLTSVGCILTRIATWLRPLLRSLSGNVLGEVKEKCIHVADGETGFVTFELDYVRLTSVGVGVSDVVWRWQFRVDRNDSWTDFAVSRHRIYTILNEPTDPWKQTPHDSANTQLPWTEVLDFACDWASGAQGVDEAATLITHNLYNLGPDFVQYVDGEGSAHYVTPGGYFNCTLFIDCLRGELRPDTHVNCSDCAVIVSTFANALGCDLWQSSMTEFDFNPIKKIGQSTWKDGNFTYHEVAWKNECDINNEVFDACLQVDGDDKPERAPHEPLLPTNLRFGTPGDKQYHFRLVAPSNPAGAAQPLPSFRRRCGIASSKELIGGTPVNEVLLNNAKRRFDFDSWPDPPGSLKEHLFVWKLLINRSIFPGWEVYYIDTPRIEGLPRSIESLWMPSASESSALLRLDLYECVSATAARELLIEILTGFQMPVLERTTAVGEIAFAAPENTSVVFARANLVVVFRNAGREKVSFLDPARLLDYILTSKVVTRERPDFSRAEEFCSAAAWPLSLDEIPLDINLPDMFKEISLMFKFFSVTGRTYSRNDQIIYKPLGPGLQDLLIVATNLESIFLYQELKLDVS